MSKSIILILSAVAALLAAGVGYVLYPSDPSEPAVAQKAEAPAVTPEASKRDPQYPKAPETVPPFATPTFDVVRINREGNAVIAGRAAPGARVTVYTGDAEVGSVTADGRGEWVLVPEMPLDSGSQTLSLRAEGEGGETAESDDVVVVMVPNRDIAADAAQQVIAVATPREAIGASRVLQGPGSSPDALSGSTVQLSTVSYDEQGRLVLAGFAPPGSVVRVRVDGHPIGSAHTDDAGYWELTPSGTVTQGNHTLTVEQLDETNRVVASVQVPFTRANVVEADLRPGELLVAVQPGNSLWRIARATYGEGVLFTEIYAANAEKIRNPDLIYPGQIFVLPPQN